MSEADVERAVAIKDDIKKLLRTHIRDNEKRLPAAVAIGGLVYALAEILATRPALLAAGTTVETMVTTWAMAETMAQKAPADILRKSTEQGA